MRDEKLLKSLPQRAYSATQVLKNEARIANKMSIAMTKLMEMAGAAVFDYLQLTYPNTDKLLVLCGKGNNGGDGFVIARLAQAHGMAVTVYLCCQPTELKGDAKIAFEHLLASQVTLIYQNERTLSAGFLSDEQFHLVVDAVFGIGFKGALPKEIAQLVEVVNDSYLPVVSVDVPSGLNASTGYVENTAITAKATVTFIAAKQGLFTGQAANYCGHLYFASLTLAESFEHTISSNVYIQSCCSQGRAKLPSNPKRQPASHKGNVGQLLTIGGGQGMPGAIRLASEAALRAGASLVTVCCHGDNVSMVANGRPELMLLAADQQALTDSHFYQKAKWLLCGPGLGQSDWAQGLFDCVLSSCKPCVLDADALSLLAKQPSYRQDWVLTPHPGEAAKLLACSIADVEQNRFAAVQQITEKYGGICVLKGAGTLIGDGHDVWINTSGNSGMASGGMGDVLSGIIAALAMQMSSTIDAVRLAVYIHGAAADRLAMQSGKIGMLASDLLPQIQHLLNQKSTKIYDHGIEYNKR
ncbi:NAD(P)H-hydrate dehydratase [Thalassotalea sp. G2M2-11]|uniref:NAD(P)H-hydrate dehydratase n=1 Tax=Thalassotalea sp. G2M2-11 TaxID=2787627 RepID=UPI0019D07E13|nr:NAD(P)H-hydrate dehydratase [Thalassotalea sp. G2M2-11]